MKRRCFKFFTATALSLAILSSLAGCMGHEHQTETLVTEKLTTTTEQTQTQADKANPSKTGADTRIILNDEKTTIVGEGASFKDRVLSITKGGTYLIEGKLSDGHILVLSADEDEKVKLLLNSVDIYCSSTAPIYIESSPRETQLIVAKNSTNTLSDNASRQAEENAANAVIYSKDDLQIQGEELLQGDKEGVLNINAEFEKGIFSKDDIQIKGAQINITSADDGIRAKDFLEISGGTITVDAGGDGLRTNNEESSKGDIQISGGTISVKSMLDAVQATGNLLVSGGSLTACTDGGSKEFTASKPEQFYGSSSDIDAQSSESKKALKADEDIEISGGKLSLDSLDNAIDAKKEVKISGSTISLSTNGKAVDSGEEIEISGGVLNVSRSYEGIESEKIYLSGGETVIKAQDDALNAASSSDTIGTSSAGAPSVSPMTSKPKATPHNMPKKPGGEEYDGDCIIEISGGGHVLYSGGDGIDSNGDVKMSGGNLVVFGSENAGNGALDFDGEFEMSGGTLLAIGSAGMAQAPTQGTYVSFTANVSANKTVAITDKSGKEIISFVSTKPFQSVIYASPSLKSGEQYSLISGVTHSGSAVNGIFTGGSFTGGKTQDESKATNS